MLLHSNSESSLTKNTRRIRGREASSSWFVRVIIIRSGDSSAESKRDIVLNVGERISIRYAGAALPPEVLRNTQSSFLRMESRKLDGSGIQGDSTGRNSTSPDPRSSQCTQSSTKVFGKSWTNTPRGIN